jgi:cytochrome c-type biogenesis protein CcmF
VASGFVYGRFALMTVVGLTAGGWVVLSSMIEPVSRWRQGHKLSASVLGMCVAHLGLGLFVLGATTVESYKIEKDLSLRPGETTQLAGYELHLVGTRNVAGPNYQAVEAEVVITRNGKTVTTLHPQKRVYRVQTSPMTEAGIDAGWNRDLFVAMGEEIGGGAWSLRLQYKPLVRFIWFGALVMAIGGLIAVTDRRYRSKATAAAPANSSQEIAASV